METKTIQMVHHTESYSGYEYNKYEFVALYTDGTWEVLLEGRVKVGHIKKINATHFKGRTREKAIEMLQERYWKGQLEFDQIIWKV